MQLRHGLEPEISVHMLRAVGRVIVVKFISVAQRAVGKQHVHVRYAEAVGNYQPVQRAGYDRAALRYLLYHLERRVLHVYEHAAVVSVHSRLHELSVQIADVRDHSHIVFLFRHFIEQLRGQDAGVSRRYIEPSAGHALDVFSRHLAADGVKAHVALEKAARAVRIIYKSRAPHADAGVRKAVYRLLRLHQRRAVQLILRKAAAHGADLPREEGRALDLIAEAALDYHGAEQVAHIRKLCIIQLQGIPHFQHSPYKARAYGTAYMNRKKSPTRTANAR